LKYQKLLITEIIVDHWDSKGFSQEIYQKLLFSFQLVIWIYFTACFNIIKFIEFNFPFPVSGVLVLVQCKESF